MALSRYNIRNSYSLADPELYKAADKDDPEALLEGVAMAGLVGVLRQLGDLAQFAAEIFQDLHEELVATAARGHGLTVRVQQIEAEFPSIEKAFLSQTSHSSFFYNTGIDWHPNVNLDQNLVTQGDLPRFVMDSYEECRGPPRLFLLDKFDVAGAGSCLKRYTDPSFFKAEFPLSVMPTAEAQRDKKSRKSKKKGSRWRNGETPEVLATSHVKLQQLLLEERVENHVSDPARRVKLKRRPNGSPLDSAMGKSYMDKILKIPTPDPDVIREISITSSTLNSRSSVAAETGNEILDITEGSPDKNAQLRKRSMYSSSDSEAGHKMVEEDYKISPKFSSTQMVDVPSKLHEVDKIEIGSEGLRNTDGHHSDEEVDNYVDALATMDSEMETDSEYRDKDNMRYSNVNGRKMGSDATEELYDFQTHSTDSQSVGNSSLVDGGNGSSRKGKSSFSYSGSFDLAENAPSEGDASGKKIPFAEHCEAEIVNSSNGNSFSGSTASSQALRHTIQDYSSNENANNMTHKNELEKPASSSCLTKSGPMLLPGDPGERLTEISSLGHELYEKYSNHSNYKAGYAKEEENSIPLDMPCMSSSDDQPSQTSDADFSKALSNSIGDLNTQETHQSHSSPIPSDSQLASDNESNGNPRNDILRKGYLEKEHALTSVASLVPSPIAFATQKEEFSEPDNESCCSNVRPDGNASENARECGPLLDGPETADHVKMQLQKSEIDHSPYSGLGFSQFQERNLDGGFSVKTCDEEVGGGLSTGDIYFAFEERSFPASPLTAGVSLDDGTDNIHSQAKDVATDVAENVVDNGGNTTSLDSRSMKIPGERSAVIQDLHQNGIEVDYIYSHEPSVEKTVNEYSSESGSISSRTLPCGYSDLDLSHHVSDKDNAVMSSYQDPKDAEARSLQTFNVIEKEVDAQCSPTHHLAETSTSEGLQVDLYNGQFDVESWHDQVSESKSAHHTVVVKDTEDALFTPKNHLVELNSPLDQKIESLNGNIKSCHVTHDQVPELRHSQENDSLEEVEDISSPIHPVVELRIPPKEKSELHKENFDLASAQHWDGVENAEDSMLPPTHHKDDPRDSLQKDNELLRNKFSVEPCLQQDSYSESFQQINTDQKADDPVFLFTHPKIELNPLREQKVELQNNPFDVKFWHDQRFELEHAQQIEVPESPINSVCADTSEFTTSINQTLELHDHFDKDSRPTHYGNTSPLSLVQQGESSTSVNRERENFPSSENSALHLPSQLSLSQFLPQAGVSKTAEDPLRPKLPTFDILPETSLNEIPPLPPLPPVQWRVEKIQQTFRAPEGNLLGHNLAAEAGNSYPSNPFLSPSSFEDDNLQDMNANPGHYVVQSADPLSQHLPDLVAIGSRMHDRTPDLVLPVDPSVHCEDVSLDSRIGEFHHSVNPFSPLTSVKDIPSALPLRSLSVQPVETLNQTEPSMSSMLTDTTQSEPIISMEKTVNLSSTILPVPDMPEHERQPVIQERKPVIQEHESSPGLSTSAEEATSSFGSSVPQAPSEDGIPNGTQKIKLPRPRNPLIDAVVAHDKSKLRKVSQLPQVGQRAEERYSLLEQIRAKSFNLKPAVVTRPSIQGPNTNIRLAAILEKANAIRQAFAGNGSDEDDDEDAWSDS